MSAKGNSFDYLLGRVTYFAFASEASDTRRVKRRAGLDCSLEFPALGFKPNAISIGSAYSAVRLQDFAGKRDDEPRPEPCFAS